MRDETNAAFISRMRKTKLLPPARIDELINRLKLAKAACEQHRWKWEPESHYA